MLTRRAFALLAVILLSTAVAQGGTLNLRWNACWGDGGIANRVFAFDTNAGSELLVLTFIPPAAVTGVTSLQTEVVLVFPDASVPAWWQFRGAGACRPTGLVGRFTPPLGATACSDWAEDSGTGLIASYGNAPFYPAQVVLLRTATLVPEGLSFDLASRHEYVAATFVINHVKSVGTGSCAGCNLGACIAAHGIDLVRASPELPYRLTPSGGDDYQATWQGAVGVGIPNYGGAGFLYCPYATPTRHPTWGAVKSLYR